MLGTSSRTSRTVLLAAGPAARAQCVAAGAAPATLDEVFAAPVGEAVDALLD